MPTVLSTSIGKTLFAWRFILNKNIYSDKLYPIRNHLFLFCFVVYSQIFILKFLRPNISLCNFYGKVKILEFLPKKIFFYFSLLILNC